MREPIVKVYKSHAKGGNGAFAIATTAADADEFLRECASEMEAVMASQEGDWEFAFAALLPQICDVWAKLRGYKADGVFERRLLVVGEPMPEAHMDCLNYSSAVTVDGDSVRRMMAVHDAELKESGV